MKKTQKTQENTRKHSDRGNTDNPIAKKSRSRKWCITLNNYTEEEYKNFLDTINTKKYLYIIGKEVGEQGTPHLQIYLESRNPVSFTTIKNYNNRFHIEKAKGNIKQNYEYCSKEGNFISNIELPETPEEKEKRRFEAILDDEYKDVKWKPFQQKILDIIDGEISRRKIYWFWETTGNIGKSYVFKYVALKLPKKVILGNGKMNDVFNQINKHIENNNEPEIVLIDVPRDYAETYFNYGGLENIKNGFFYSGKYEGGKCLFKIPHIIVISNEEPNYDKLSKDRYEVINLEGV